MTISISVYITQPTALEHFLSLYVFVTYLDNTDFLYDRTSSSGQIIDFYGSFYMGVVSFVSSIVAALAVYLDDSIFHRPKQTTSSSLMTSQQNDVYKVTR